MLHTTINNTNFQKSLQNYLLAHEQGNAKDFELWQKFDEVMLNSTNIHDWNSMPLNVTKYMTPWFYQETFPIIKVVTTSDGLSYNFQQTPFIQSGLPNNQSSLWPIQLWFETEFYERRNFTWLASQSTLPRAFPRGWRVVNPKREAYVRVW
jgi:aminopeptidase N